VETFGFKYIGVIDGHDIDNLLKVFSDLKNIDGKLFLHIRTKKGKGYLPAEKNPLAFHQPFTTFNINTGDFNTPDCPLIANFFNSHKTLEDFGLKYLKENSDAFFVFPATPPFENLLSAFPERVIDVGIAEQACITFATSLSISKKKVFLPIFATFLSRCFSQIIDLCLSGAPVVIVSFFNGLTPFGLIQQALLTLNILRSVPDCVILQPCNLKEFEDALHFASVFTGPIFVQAPKENFITDMPMPPIKLGKGYLMKEGSRLTVLPIGGVFNLVDRALKYHEGIELINPRFIEPFDYDLLVKSVKKTGKLLIIEDSYKSSGFGAEIINYLRENSIEVKVSWVAAEKKFLKGKEYTSGAHEFLKISNRNVEDSIDGLFND